MKLLSLCAASTLALFLAVACDSDSDNETDDKSLNNGEGGSGANSETSQSERPLALGERGTSCDVSSDCVEGLSCIVKNDCQEGLSCVRKSCQPSNFDVMGTGKQCHTVHCATTADCCGDKSLTEPDKCKGKADICDTPTLTECSPVLGCSTDAECGTGAGTCKNRCSLSPYGYCDTNADCPNVCNITVAGTGGTPAQGTCQYGSAACAMDSDCTAASNTSNTNTCGGVQTKRCDCTNPVYEPTNVICTDTDCDNVCTRVCEDQICEIDDSCESDNDCSLAAPMCDAGDCVQCKSADDCDADAKEQCVAGVCGSACKEDTQCPAFNSCQDGECVETGCKTDRECILLSAGQRDSDQDPRLSKCTIKDGQGICTYPCEIDAQCGSTEVCVNNVCEFIGCETNAECKAFTGLNNQPAPTPEQPWIVTTECRALGASQP